MANSIIGGGVTIEGIYDPIDNFTFNVAQDVTAGTIYQLVTANYPITQVGVPSGMPPLGYAVTMDTTIDTGVRLAKAGDPILGRIVRVENRIQEGIVVVAVQTKGGFRFYADPTSVIAYGDALTGSNITPGYVSSVQADLALTAATAAGSGATLSTSATGLYVNASGSIALAGTAAQAISAGGTLYTNGATITFPAPTANQGFIEAQGVLTVAGGVVTGLTITNPGTGYTPSAAGSAANTTFIGTVVVAGISTTGTNNKLTTVSPAVYHNLVTSINTGAFETFNTTSDVTTLNVVPTVVALLR